MISKVLIEKMLSIAVLFCALIVGFLTIRHGEMSLGVMLLLGQAQVLMGGNGHGAANEAQHIILHQKL